MTQEAGGLVSTGVVSGSRAAAGVTESPLANVICTEDRSLTTEDRLS
jgi:hypothetical protein